MRRITCLLLAAGLALAGPAFAHHSLIGYDQAKRVTLEGVVADFRFGNPHPFLTINVGPDRHAWRLEMDNLYELKEIGITRDTFQPGQKVVVSGAPDRTGASQLYLYRLDRPADGLQYEQIGFTPYLRTVPKGR